MTYTKEDKEKRMLGLLERFVELDEPEQIFLEGTATGMVFAKEHMSVQDASRKDSKKKAKAAS